MVEMMVAISIFAFTATGVAALMGTLAAGSRGNNRNRAVAANLASQEMDVVRSTEFTELPLGTLDDRRSRSTATRIHDPARDAVGRRGRDDRALRRPAGLHARVPAGQRVGAVGAR